MDGPSPLDPVSTTSHVKTQAQREAERAAKTPEGIAEKRIATLEAELKALKQELKDMRITGPGFSGQGPRGIMFEPTNDVTGNTITVRICVDGEAVDQKFLVP
jgi:hypothetical protein